MSEIRLVQYHTFQKGRTGHNSSVRVALVKAGHKWLQVLAIDATTDGGLRVWKVRKDEEQYMWPLRRKGKPYPMARALGEFRKFAKEHGISKSAKKLLKEAGREEKARKDAAGKAAAQTSGDHAEVGSNEGQDQVLQKGEA